MTQQDADTLMDEDFEKYAFVSMKMEHEDNSCQDEIIHIYIKKKPLYHQSELWMMFVM